MRTLRTFLLGWSLCLAFCLFAPSRSQAQTDWPVLSQTQVAGGISTPVHITSARDGSDRLFVVQQSGQIVIIQSNSVLPQPFLNITNRVNYLPGSMDGLLSMAFATN